MRPELIDRWDLRIFVSTALEKTVDRAVIRERRVSCPVEVERRWRERYIPPDSSTSLRSARPITPTSSCTTTRPQQPVRETRRQEPQPGIG